MVVHRSVRVLVPTLVAVLSLPGCRWVAGYDRARAADSADGDAHLPADGRTVDGVSAGADLPAYGDGAGDGALVSDGVASSCPGAVIGGICVIDDPMSAVSCPAELPCHVRCNARDSCPKAIDCGDAACTIDCMGLYACAGPIVCGQVGACTINCLADTCSGAITCGPAACTLDCGADTACGEVDCSSSCACTLYGREGQFAPSSCPFDCAVMDGCSASSSGCDTC